MNVRELEPHSSTFYILLNMLLTREEFRCIHVSYQWLSVASAHYSCLSHGVPT